MEIFFSLGKKKMLQSLFDKLREHYQVYDQALYNKLSQLNDEGQLTSWKQFAIALADYHAQDEEDMNVFKSSTWAVCQEFIGNLRGGDLRYAKKRGGIWSLDGQISVREILIEFQLQFPE